jgi:DNA polymerase-3 subunit gamma/tau
MLGNQYNQGADPTVILQDMLELTHWLTRLKVVPDAGEDAVTSEAERKLGGEMAQQLSMPVLTRTWQMLLKGLQETREAASPLAAAEMVLVRLIYAIDLPDPADLVRQLTSTGAGNGSGAGPRQPAPSGSGSSATSFRSISGGGAATSSQPMMQPAPTTETALVPNPESYRALVALFEEQKEPRLAIHLSDHVHLVKFSPGRLEIRLTPEAPAELPHRLSDCLNRWTGTRWVISLSQDAGDTTLREEELAAEAKARAEALAHPLVQAALKAFPGAEITDIRSEAEDEDLPFDAAPLFFDDGFGIAED